MLSLAGCLSLGPSTLKVDQIDYARALGEAKKREILALIVGLRYADSPALLTVSQIISGYTFTASATPLTESVPPGPVGSLTGTATYSDHPTFTFTPTTGETYAKSYIHPLAPQLILPLVDSGVPIDLLMRITVQSIGGLSNAVMLGGPSGNGSPGFFQLLAVLRRLQLAGQISILVQATAKGEEVSLVLGVGHSPLPEESADMALVRELLKLPAGTKPYPVVVGQGGERSIPMTTRSILAILSNLGAEIEVPAADVANGTTKPATQLVGGESRPIVLIHAAKSVVGTPYAAVKYRGAQFWIDDADFDSKFAVSVVQALMALAQETSISRAPVVTVPAS